MANQLDRILQVHPHPYLTHDELEVLLGGTANSRYGKVKRWIAQGKLLHIRRGLYCLTDSARYFTKPHPFELAQYIYGPSYISLESALNFHGLIPETVYTVTSVCSKRSKEFHTPLGVFSYSHLPSKNFYIGAERVEENGYSFFLATPWKAIFDYIFCYKKFDYSLKLLLEYLRINQENLPILRHEDLQLLDEYYHHSRMTQLFKKFLKG